MKTREKNFLDIEKRKMVYSFQIYWGGKWLFLSDGKDGIQKFATQKEVDAARSEWRKKKDL